MNRNEYHRPNQDDLRKESDAIESQIQLMITNKQNWWFMSQEFTDIIRRRNILGWLGY